MGLSRNSGVLHDLLGMPIFSTELTKISAEKAKGARLGGTPGVSVPSDSSEQTTTKKKKNRNRKNMSHAGPLQMK
jgi:hypothetical protein